MVICTRGFRDIFQITDSGNGLNGIEYPIIFRQKNQNYCPIFAGKIQKNSTFDRFFKKILILFGFCSGFLWRCVDEVYCNKEGVIYGKI